MNEETEDVCALLQQCLDLRCATVLPSYVAISPTLYTKILSLQARQRFYIRAQ